MSRQPRDPDAAPRGKQFAIARLSHVAPAPRLLVLPVRFDRRSQADQAVAHIDARLTPLVVIVDREAP